MCRKNDQEIKLRSNLILEELVEAFQSARPKLLEHATMAASSPSSTASNAPKRRSSEADPEYEDGQPRKKTRSSTRIASRPASQTPTIDPAVFEDERPEPEQPVDDGLVECPICSERVKIERINGHIDSVHANPAPQTSSRKPTPLGGLLKSSKPPPSHEHLPAVSYNMMNDSALRKKLSSLGLSQTGSRQQLERRHREWVNLWNANCDASKPRPVPELKADLKTWERTQNVAPAPPGFGMAQSTSAVASKTFDGAAWSASHQDDFRDLIAKAKAKARPKAAEPEPRNGDRAPLVEDGTVFPGSAQHQHSID
jgi:E3 ubiquitin-protein ligase RAD18